MSEGQRSTLLAYLRRLCGPTALDGSDAELLERFAVGRDELAFETLLRRHGPLVYGVCRRVLSDEHAAEDAFQATFLVLVRQAASVSKKASIRSWLYGVALRVALRARQREELRRRREQEIPPRPSIEATLEPDVRSILDEEIQRLPEKYRLPIILCYLESRTNDEAAQMLNCPRGTIAVRLARARERLRSRLLRRGVTLAAMTALLSDNALSASVPALLFSQTAKTALTGAASHSITTLAEGVLHAMYMTKIKAAAAMVLLLATMGGGVGFYYLKAQAPLAPQIKATDKQPEAAKPAKEGKERIKELLEKRKERAEKEWTIRWNLYKVGSNEPGSGTPITLTQVIAASKHLLKAEAELSDKRADRVAAHERNVERLKEIAEVSQVQFKVGRLFEAAVAQAQYEQLDAEIALEREKAR
jgi:RNA polymerase sigma factor (sigma-70 family)